MIRRDFLQACLGAAASAAAPALAVEAARPLYRRAPVRLRFVSARDGEPVRFAEVSLGGRTWLTDAAGQMVVEEDLVPWATLSVRAAGHLERRTLVRWDETFPLWPLSRHLTPAYVQRLVYGGRGGALCRFVGEAVSVVPDVTVAADERAMRALRHASATAEEATGVAFRLAAPAAPGPRIEVRHDPHDRTVLETQATAVFRRRGRGFAIEGGVLTVADMAYARCEKTLLHEFGHLWFWHSPDGGDMMALSSGRRRTSRFTRRERTLARLLRQRHPGSRFEDDDAHLGVHAALVSAGRIGHRSGVAPDGRSAAAALAGAVFRCA